MLLAFVFAAALDTAATPPTTVAPPVEAKQNKPKSEMICRYDAVTGTHLKQRVCMTREEAEAATERDQDQIRQLQSEHTRMKNGFGPGS